MPRSHTAPAYQKHASGQARVTLNGRDHYLGKYGSPESKARYEELVRRYLADRLRDELTRSVALRTDLTVNEAILRYLTHAQEYYVKNGRVTNQHRMIRLALRVVRERFGDLEAKDFGPKALKECQKAFVEQGLSRNEANRRVRLVRSCFGWLVAEELIPAATWEALKAVQPLRKGRTPAPERPPVRPIHEAMVAAVLPHVTPPVAAMIRLQELTGMRPDEVVQMRTGDLNIARALWEYRPGSHKLDHHEGIERVVVIGPRAQEILRPWLRTALDSFLFSPRESLAKHHAERRKARQTPLWPSHEAAQERKRKARPIRAPRDRYDVASYRRAIYRGCDLAFPHPTLAEIAEKDLTDDQRTELAAWRKAHRWSPNRLRHSTATRVRRELGIEAARALLGHADADTTTIYAERDLELAREAMARLG
jgi:integrase